MPDVSTGPALHQGRRGRAVGAGHPAAAARTAASACSISRAPSSTRSPSSHVEILTLLASQAAVAIENARLYETIRANEVRLEKEIRFAQRVQAALLPTELPKRLQGRRRRRALRAGARARRRPLRFPRARAEQPGRRRRRRLGQGRAGGALQRVCRRAGPLADVPAALRARALQPGRRAGVDQHDPPRAPARGVLLHALLRGLRLQAPHGDDGQLGPAVSDPLSAADSRAQIELPGVPLGSFAGLDATTRSTFDLAAGDVFVFCTDGVFEAHDADGCRSSAPSGCSRSSRRTHDQAARARSSTRSSPPSRSSAATRRRTTT